MLQRLKIWVKALRLKTLVVSIAAVTIGLSLTLNRVDEFPLVIFVGCLVFAIFVQVGTNFTNDYFDFINGADSNRYLGPDRVVASGFLPPSKIKDAYRFSFLMALVVGASLVLHINASLWFFPFGILCITAGYCYTGGPYPFAYNGLGDIFVVLFFGFGAVEGTNLLICQSVGIDWIPAYHVSGSVGMLINNLLVVNNYRDYEADLAVNKRTSVVIFGKKFGIFLYLFGFICPCTFFLLNGNSDLIVTSCLVLGFLGLLFLVRAKSKSGFSKSLSITVLNVISFAVLFLFNSIQ